MRPLILDRVSFLVTRLLSVRPMNFNSLAEALPVSRKKLSKVIKELIRQDAVANDSNGTGGSIGGAARGRPRVWLYLTKSGLDLFRRHLSAILVDLDVLFGEGFLVGPWLSCQAYGARFALPPIEVVVKNKDLVKNPLVKKEFKGVVDRFFVWAGDRDPFERGRHVAIAKAQVPVLSVEDLILFAVRFDRNPELVKVIPAVLSDSGFEFDYVYLHRKAAEYGVLQEVGFLLDVASYLDPELEAKTGITLFSRDRRGFGDRNFFPLKKEKAPSHPRIVAMGQGPYSEGSRDCSSPIDVSREAGGIVPHQWFWRLKRTPALDEFIETYVTYTSGAKTERLLSRLYDEGYWLLTKEINADLLKFYVER